MTPETTELIGLLKEMRELLGRLEPMILEERRALVNLEFDLLHQLAETKNEAARVLAKRRDRAKEVLRRLGLAKGGADIEKVTDILPWLPAEERDELNRNYLVFQAKAQEVEFLSAHNRVLAEEGLLVMSETVRAIFSPPVKEATYHPAGVMRAAAAQAPARVCREV